MTSHIDRWRERLTGANLALGVSLIFAFVIASFYLMNPLAIGGNFPNHLAKSYILAFINQSESLQAYYTVDLEPMPNLGMDLVTVPLAHLFGIYSAGAIALTLATVSLPLAGIWLTRTLYGSGSTSWMSLIGWISAFNLTLAYGWISSLIASGFAVVLFTVWVRMSDGWLRTGLLSMSVILLALSHALGFLLLGYLILWWEIARVYEARKSFDLKSECFRWARTGLVFLPAFLILIISYTLYQSDQVMGMAPVSLVDSIMLKLSAGSFFHYSHGKGVILSLAILIGLAFWLYPNFREKRLALHPRMVWVVLALLGLIVILPDNAAKVGGLYTRLTPTLIVLFFASFSRTGTSPSLWPVSLGITVTTLAISLVLSMQYARVQQAPAERMRHVFSQLSSEARLMTVHSLNGNFGAIEHAPKTAVIEAELFISGLYTNTSPVNVHPDFRHLHFPVGNVNAELFLEGADEALESPDTKYNPYFFRGWPETFTHILFLRSEGDTGLTSEKLCSLHEDQEFILYTVQSVGTPCPSLSG